jgi:protein-tyrosine-phosphatase
MGEWPERRDARHGGWRGVGSRLLWIHTGVDLHGERCSRARSHCGRRSFADEFSLSACSQTVDSCGTSGEHDGDPPDDRSIAVAKKHGLDISSHISRRLAPEDWTRFSYILAMDSSNYRNAKRMKPANATAQLVMYLPSGDVPDPWYGSAAGFTDCYNLLLKHAGHTFDRIAKDNGKSSL